MINMRSIVLLVGLAALLPVTISAPTTTLTSDIAPLPSTGSDGGEATEVIAKEAVASQDSSVPTSTLEELIEPTPLQSSGDVIEEDDENVVYIEPPPIFDPPEPRPDTIFDSPRRSTLADILRPPPLPEHRLEHIAPFDGAHVHPDDTPYRPEPSEGCSAGALFVKLLGAVTVLMGLIYILLLAGKKMHDVLTRVFGKEKRQEEEEGLIRLEDEKCQEGRIAFGAGSEVKEGLARSRSASKGTSTSQ